MWVSYVKSL